MSRHFTNKVNRYMFAAITILTSENEIRTIDAYNIIEALGSTEETKRYADELSVEQVNEVIDMSDILARASPEEYRLLAKKVKDAAFRRDTYNKLKECETYCFDKNVDDIEHKIYQTLDDVMLEFNANTDIPEYKDIVDKIWEEIEERHIGNTSAIDFPFPILNNYVVMEPGECVCFAAPQKAGKSSLLLTVTVDLLSKGKSVLYIDSEISTKLFTMRLLAHLSGVPFGKIRSGNYDEVEKERLDNSVAWMKDKKFIHHYVPIMDDDTLYLLAKKGKHLIDMDVIIVDYLKANSNDDKAYSVYASLGRITDTLKNRIAGEMRICAVTAAQTTNSGKIADSAKIARNVSTVVTITEKSVDEMEPGGDQYSTRKARVVYNRNGAQMMENEWIDMDFDGSLCKYWESPEQHTAVTPY